ncbi:ATP-binding protein [Streptomyces sp. NPDC003401]
MDEGTEDAEGAGPDREPAFAPDLAPAGRERVLGRFCRIDDSRTRTTGGSGLGLAIADALVPAHGGRITLDTAPGQGCAFRIVLPPPDSSPHGIADEATGDKAPGQVSFGVGEGVRRTPAKATLL